MGSLGDLEKRVVKKENVNGIKGTEDSYYSPIQRGSSKSASLSWFIPLGACIFVTMDEPPSKIFGGVLVAAGIGALALEGYIQPINFIEDAGKMACYLYDMLKKHI